MEYAPLSAVWELTMACNMRCRHCGSACAEGLPDELTTDQALRLCDDLADMGLVHLTLSGGEPLLRRDWDLVAGRLAARGVEVTMISNGWLVNESVIERARSAGLRVMGTSIDGLEATHDWLRKPGAFRRACGALNTLARAGFPAGVVTTLVKRNLPELPALKRLLIEHGVGLWQLQFGNPMGNLAGHRDELVEPDDVLPILEFAEAARLEGRIVVRAADCLGYHTRLDAALRQAEHPEPVSWQGCPAGKLVVGIRHNGDICGCNSMREEAYIEGNVRDTPIRELWTRPGAFAWNRCRTRDSLTGFCGLCHHGETCLAGCTSTRLTLGESEGEYRFCAYRILVEGMFPKIDRMRDPRRLADRAATALELGIPEVEYRCLARATEFEPHDEHLRDRLNAAEARLRATRGAPGPSVTAIAAVEQAM